MMVWRIEGYVFLVLAVVLLAAFVMESNRTALGLAVVCLVLGVTGLADSLDGALIPVLAPISVACAGVTLWLTRRSRPPGEQQPVEKG